MHKPYRPPKKEARALNTYVKLMRAAESVTDPVTRDALNELADDEKEHKCRYCKRNSDIVKIRVLKIIFHLLSSSFLQVEVDCKCIPIGFFIITYIPLDQFRMCFE